MSNIDLSKIKTPPVLAPLNYDEILERGIQAYARDESLEQQSQY